MDDARKRLGAILAADRQTSMLTCGSALSRRRPNLPSRSTEFRKSVAADAQSIGTLPNNLAYLLADYANKPDEALAYAEKARELGPGQPDYADTLGWVFYQKGIYSSAVKQMETAAAEKKTDALVRYHLAMAYAKSGDATRSRAAYEAALKLNPNLPEARMTAGIVGVAK